MSAPAKTSKHDTYLQELHQKLVGEYDFVKTHITLYSKRNRKIAEIDILACKDGYWDIYEVKCSHRIAKARKQLHRIKRIMPHARNVFFYCGATDELMLI